MKNARAAFIGCGAMGGALAQAVKKARTIRTEVIVSAFHKEEAYCFATKYRCLAASSNTEAVHGADVVFIAVKPHDVKGVLQEIDGAVEEGASIISVAAGVTLKEIAQWTSRPVARIMPNIGAAVGQSMTAVCYNSAVTNEQKEVLHAVLCSTGVVCEVDEALMPCVTAVSGSGPAYVFMFIEALSDAAVRGGMKREDAYIFAKQTVLGAAALAMKDKRSVAELKDAVCSPAGTTIEGVAALEERGFRGAVMAAVKAAMRG